MIAVSREVTDAEVSAAAAYFSTLTPRSKISVVEAASALRTFAAGRHLAAVKSRD